MAVQRLVRSETVPRQDVSGARGNLTAAPHRFPIPSRKNKNRERPMHDTVIRGGTIVDGTGKAAYTGDVALDGDKIAQVGGKAGPGKREIDAGRPAGDAGLGRCPYSLRRPGDLGSGAGAVVLARRDHHPVRQLRRRFRPGAERRSFRPDRHDGIDRGNSRDRAGRRVEVELGDVSGISRCAGADAAGDRYRRADSASSAAGLCDGRPGDQSGNGDGRRYRGDARRGSGRAEGRRVRLHHVAHQFAQDAVRRHGARALLRSR